MDKILIVDDTQSNRFLLRTMLAAANYEVAECSNGQEALELCAREVPTLVLMDVMMPVMDGIEACKELRKKFSAVQLPIIIVTTRDESETLPEALRAGANDYLAKPINREVMLARIRNQIDLKQSRAETDRALEIQTTTAESLPQGLGIVSATGDVVLANRSWKEACGGRESGSLDEAIAMFYGGALRDFLSALQAKVLKNPQGAFDEEFESETGPVRNVHVTTRPIHTRGGEALRLWLIQDVSRTRELERKFAERVKLESVGLLVKGFAHNFNNILGGVSGALEIVEKYVSKEERAQRAFRIAKRGAAEATRLTKKLTAFSEAETAQGAQFDTEPLDEVLGAIVLMYQDLAAERITISLDVPRPFPKIRLGVAAMVEISNHLITNAVEAISDTGKIEIAAVQHPDGKLVSIAFRDSGRGMEPEMLRRVLEPFYTTKNLDVRNSVGVDGHGLGLWTVYNLVKMAGGELNLQSQVGKGTTVTITLPVLEPSTEA